MAEDIINIRTRIAGTSRRQKWVWHLENDTPVYLEREPQNPYDPNAIAVYAEIPHHGHKQIGYIPREIAADIAPYLDQGYTSSARIIALFGGEPGKPTRGLALSITLKKAQPRAKRTTPKPKPQPKPEPQPAPTTSPKEAETPPLPPKNLPLAWLLFFLTAIALLVALAFAPLLAISAAIVLVLLTIFISPQSLTCPTEAHIIFGGLTILIAFISLPVYLNGASPSTTHTFTALLATATAFTAYTWGKSLACPRKQP